MVFPHSKAYSVAVHSSDASVGKAVLEAEGFDYFVPDIAEGWDILEKV